MRTAIIAGDIYHPQILITPGTSPALKNAYRLENGYWTKKVWEENPARLLAKAGISLKNARLVKHLYPPLIDFQDGKYHYYPRLKGTPLPHILSASQAARYASYATLTTTATKQLLKRQIPKNFALPLYPYQKEGAKNLAARKPYIADEPGLGKTRQALAALALCKVDKTIIVCPPVVVSAWAKETQLANIFSTVTPIYAGKNFVLPDKGAIIVADSLLAARENLLKEIISWAPQAMVVDEIHRMKNAKAKRTKTVTKLSKKIDGPIYGLSGTPMLSSPIELYPQFRIVRRMDEVFGSVNNFLSLYTTKNPWGGYEAKRKALPDLYKKANESIWTRRLKKDVLPDLPPKERRALLLDVDLKLYREAHKKVGEKIDEWLEIIGGKPNEEMIEEYCKNSLPLISQLRAAAGLCKIDAATEIIENWIDAHPPIDGIFNDPIIVWGHHREVTEKLFEATKNKLGKTNVEAILGGMGGKHMADVAERFQNGQIGVLVASITAAGIGITLTRSCEALMVETDWTPANVVQAEDRQARISQKRKVRISTLIALGTLDETIQRAQKEKAKILLPVLGGDQKVNITEKYTDPAKTIIYKLVQEKIDARFQK